jgi:hypothetical protein
MIGSLLLSHSLLACAACYGQSDSPLAQGMNWGILSLLATIVLVLGAIAAFFVSLARRSAELSRASAAAAPATPAPASATLRPPLLTGQLTPSCPNA